MPRLRPKVVKLRKGRIPEDSELVRTLIFMLGLAREGRLLGYAMVTLIEAAGGTRTKLSEAACAYEDRDAHHLLGGIRRMEQNFMRRNWPEDSNAEVS